MLTAACQPGSYLEVSKMLPMLNDTSSEVKFHVVVCISCRLSVQFLMKDFVGTITT